jgi:LmbE family N-acetylglucosaminyl deacetylase
VLSCGQVLARHPGSTLVTVFAGAPDDGRRLTPWDRTSGFQSAAAALAARRREDETAAGRLGAHVVHLPFVDAQYEEDHDPADIAGALVDVLATGPVLVPIGLFHEDHAMAHEASVRALARGCRPPGRVALYEDSPYRSIDGGRLLDDRLRELCRRRRLHHVAIDEDDAVAAKEVAVQCYESQLRALASTNAAALDDVYRPEGYWVLDGSDDWL